MEVPEITLGIARRVLEVRKRQGITAQRLAELLQEQGVPWDRSFVSKLENGHRENVTVVQLLALARVLNVAPIHLLVPPEAGGAFHVTPIEAVPPSEARAWIRGDEPLAGTTTRIFRTEVPLNELGRS